MIAEFYRKTKTEPDPDSVQPWHASRDEFYRLLDMDFFRGRRVEWMDGEIFTSPSPSGPHGSYVDSLTTLCVQRFNRDFAVRVQNPLGCPKAYLAPDLALIRKEDYRWGEVPTTAGVVIEIAFSSLRYDLDAKSEHYAEANVDQYWVLDVVAKRVYVLSDPDPASCLYRTTRLLAPNDTLRVPGTDVVFSQDELLKFKGHNPN